MGLEVVAAPLRTPINQNGHGVGNVYRSVSPHAHLVDQCSIISFRFVEYIAEGDTLPGPEGLI